MPNFTNYFKFLKTKNSSCVCRMRIVVSSMISSLSITTDYSCSCWGGRVPRQGLLYLSINYLCFHSTFLGKEISFVVKFSDIIVSVADSSIVHRDDDRFQSVERVDIYITETIRVQTRFRHHDFTMFNKIDETFQVLEQLANFAAKK